MLRGLSEAGRKTLLVLSIYTVATPPRHTTVLHSKTKRAPRDTASGTHKRVWFVLRAQRIKYIPRAVSGGLKVETHGVADVCADLWLKGAAQR